MLDTAIGASEVDFTNPSLTLKSLFKTNKQPNSSGPHLLLSVILAIRLHIHSYVASCVATLDQSLQCLVQQVHT